jgi:hypothetical protein
MKQINMSITDDRHKKIKTVSMDNKITMSQALDLMIDNFNVLSITSEKILNKKA